MMRHFTSGKRGYRLYNPRLKPRQDIPRDVLRNMLVFENGLRTSKEFQEKYSQQDDPQHFVQVTREIQERTLSQFGYSLDFLTVYQSSRALYQGDKALWSGVLYENYDISREGSLKEGCPVPDCRLYSLATAKETHLHDYLRSLSSDNTKPLVIIAGSAT
eukprot:TRINITY_DN2576_c0_g1_i4.p1 TRINITY_DN2576_c0_g1~~TRINITY_DN2576_c0_g1_i4.p1  ORF type:complete len:177 (+),score=25.94 TRINITY_DN2576_c0_g1_i4:54-533(+)